MYVSDSGCALSCDVGNLSENDKILVENLKMRIVGNEGFFLHEFPSDGWSRSGFRSLQIGKLMPEASSDVNL